MRHLIPLLVLVAAAGVACSSDDDPSSFCEDRVELQGSIQDLRDVNVIDDGIEALDSQLNTVLADLETVRQAAGDLQPEVDAVKTAVETLQSSVESATTPADKAVALTAGLADLSTSWEALETAADSDCDG